MLKFAQLTALAIVGLLTAAQANAAESKAATVNGVAIPQARVDMRLKFAENQGQKDSPELRSMIKDDLINLEVLSQEAVKKGLDKQTETVQQLELARQSTLAGAFVQDYIKNHPVSEDAMKKEYESLKAQRGSSEYNVAHILIENEADAKAIAAELKKGGKFNALAKAKSKDPGSAQQGGEMGWHAPSDFVPEFSNAMVKLKKGQVSEPVQTQFGWHIIKLIDTRNATFPPFEQVKPRLLQQMQQQTVQKLIADMRAAAKIE